MDEQQVFYEAIILIAAFSALYGTVYLFIAEIEWIVGDKEYD
jgi:hypothetical protein